ncbi:MAG: hypothetical protein ISR50_20365 [Alphaproteobacteria bacterium]|nr:hypothetical protein [Alphaproteobacteria bacterium]MBL6954995.1 hypothetical protein [Alphaproteobacteria bacterium]
MADIHKQYWLRVHERALSVTRTFLGLGSRDQIVLRALIGFAVIAGLWIWGSADAAGDETIFRGVVLGVVIALFPLVYACNFVTAPANLDNDKTQDMLGQRAEASRRISDLEAKHVPKIAIEFDPKDNDFVALTRVGEWPRKLIGLSGAFTETGIGVWIRVRPYSLTGAPVRRCVARVLGVQRVDDSGEVGVQRWGDSLQLSWAVAAGASYQEKDVFGRDIKQFVDVASVFGNDDKLWLCINDRPNRNPGIFDPGHTYRITVGVISQEDGQVAKIELDVKWGGDLDKLQISEPGSSSVYSSYPQDETSSPQLPQGIESDTPR